MEFPLRETDKKGTHRLTPGRMPLLLRLDLCLFLFSVTPSCPSWRIARRERFFPSLFDLKLCRVMLNRLTPFVRFSCAHAGNLERQDGLARTIQRSALNASFPGS